MSLSPKARIVALIVAAAFFMQNLDNSIIATSLPQMALSFQVRALDLSIGITIYMLSAAVFMPLSGWVADRYGARNVFLVAMAVFTLASLVCGLSNGLTSFVIARAAQGLGGALTAPVGRMVVLRSTEKSQLIHATALITWPALTAPVIGPALGGFITTYASWRWNFWINVPIGLITMGLALKFIPNTRDASPRNLDWLGFFLSGGALSALLYGLDSFAHTHSEWLWPSLITLAGVTLSFASLWHFRRAQHPLLDLASFGQQTFFTSVVGAGLFIRIAISAAPFLLPLLFQLGFGLNAWGSGMLILAYFAGNLGIKPVTTPLLRNFGFRSVMLANGAAVGISLLAMTLFDANTAHWIVVGVLLFAGSVRSMQFTAQNTLTFADVAEDQRGAASTMSSMMNQVSMAAGVAVGALLLNISQALNGHSQLELIDFRIAFVVVGIMALLASARFLSLPRNAGAEVSGHQSAQA